MPEQRYRWLALATILLLALNLRTAVSSLSPVATYIAEELTLSIVALGLLGLAAPLAFAVASTLSLGPARRFGIEQTAMLVALMVVGGHLARGFALDASMLFLGSLLSLLGAGVGNVLLPVLVRKYFPNRIGLVSTLYITATATSATIGSFFAVPVAQEFGWRLSLAQWAILGSLTILPLIPLVLRARRNGVERAERPGHIALYRSPTAWAITLALSASAIFGYVSFAFLPVLLIEHHGVTTLQGGQLLALFAALGLPPALFVPLLAARYPATQAPMVFVSSLLGIAGSLGILFGPSSMLWLSVSAFGLLPSIFPLTLTLFNLRSRQRPTVLAMSSFAQGVAYGTTTAVVFLVGLLRELTGEWVVALWLMFAIAVATGLLTIQLAKRKMIEDEVESR
jgi:MFS transporter, CP family, cyanate transporter